MIINVKKSHEFQRIDQYLVDQIQQSRAQIQQKIKQRLVTVNQQYVKASYLIQEGDMISIDDTVEIPQDKLFDCPPTFLYEDEHIAVLHKPINMAVHSDNTSLVTLLDYLQHFKMHLADVSETRPGIVHRLDKMTEGLMVVAKTVKAFEALKEQFKQRTVIKKYYAVVKGDFSRDFCEITRPIGRHPSKRHLFVVRMDGKEAITHVTVLKRFNTKTLCDVEIKTGRTHQIRVHLSDMGFPIINDSEYGPYKKSSSQLLQSYYLSFSHPISNSRFSFEIPLSDRLK